MVCVPLLRENDDGVAIEHGVFVINREVFRLFESVKNSLDGVIDADFVSRRIGGKTLATES
jgi:hypothetical protein